MEFVVLHQPKERQSLIKQLVNSKDQENKLPLQREEQHQKLDTFGLLYTGRLDH